MIPIRRYRSLIVPLIAAFCALSAPAGADVVAEWNAKGAETVQGGLVEGP